MATWNLDKAHSELEFKVKHMMISNIKGLFEDFDVTVEGDSSDLSQSTITVEIKADSITTKNDPRDQHLRGPEFFNAATYPLITFKSTAILKIDNKEYQIMGDLTIRNVTKSITLAADYGGLAKDPWGNQKAGYTVSGKINRQDFGLTWNAALETGGVMVSEEVKFGADIQFVVA